MEQFIPLGTAIAQDMLEQDLLASHAIERYFIGEAAVYIPQIRGGYKYVARDDLAGAQLVTLSKTGNS